MMELGAWLAGRQSLCCGLWGMGGETGRSNLTGKGQFAWNPGLKSLVIIWSALICATLGFLFKL